MKDDEKRMWAERAVRAVNLVFPDTEFMNWPLIAKIMPHALICAGFIDEWHFEFEDAARLLNQAGLYQYQRAEYGDAEQLLKRGLAIYEKSLGLDHPYVATSLNNLAQLLKATNRLAEAEPMMRRALLIFKQSLGMQHPNTQTVLNNYRILLQTSGRSEEEIQEILGKEGIQYEDIGEKMEPSPELRAVIEQVMRDPSKIAEIGEKLQKEDQAQLMDKFSNKISIFCRLQSDILNPRSYIQTPFAQLQKK